MPLVVILLVTLFNRAAPSNDSLAAAEGSPPAGTVPPHAGPTPPPDVATPPSGAALPVIAGPPPRSEPPAPPANPPAVIGQSDNFQDIDEVKFKAGHLAPAGNGWTPTRTCGSIC